MQRILDELRWLGKKGGVWKCLENVLEFGKQALAHYLRDHSITINDMMVKDKDSGTTFVVSALPHTCISITKQYIVSTGIFLAVNLFSKVLASLASSVASH